MAHASQHPFQFGLSSIFRLTAGAALLAWLIALYPLVLFVAAVYLGGTLMLVGLIGALYLSALALASIFAAWMHPNCANGQASELASDAAFDQPQPT